jgi:hypothetical protein
MALQILWRVFLNKQCFFAVYRMVISPYIGTFSKAVIKAGRYQALTQQLRDYITHSQNTGEKFSLYTTNPNFTPSGPLQEAIDSGLINHMSVP